MFPKSAPDVAILDSVIQPAKLPLYVNLTQVSVRNGYIEPLDSVGACDQEHGSVCARIIASEQDPFSMLAIDIFGENNRSTLDKLMMGLKYAIKRKPLIIHLSVGLEQLKRRNELEQLCKDAYDKGINVVAATPCTQNVWPACFDSVVAVAAKEDVLEIKDAEEYWDLLAPGIDSDSEIKGSSIAAAFVTNKILKELRNNGNKSCEIGQLKEMLLKKW